MDLVKLLLLFLLLSAGSCHRHLSPVKKKPGTEFGIANTTLWEQKKLHGVDLYFVNDKDNAILYINAECRKSNDTPLVALTSQLLMNFSEVTYKRQEYITVAEREALLSLVSAKMDGIQEELLVAVLKKNRCIFDAVVSAKVITEDLEHQFRDILKSFFAKAEL